jgi:hypothetical protein
VSRKLKKISNLLIIALPLILFIGREAIHPLFHQHTEQSLPASLSDLYCPHDTTNNTSQNKTGSKLSANIRHIECVICSGLILHAMLPETVWAARYILKPQKFIPHNHIVFIPAKKSNYRPRAPPNNLY